VRNGDKIEFHKHLVGEGAVGPGHQGIGAHTVVSPDRIRIAIKHGFSEIGRRYSHQSWNDSTVSADHLIALIRNEVGSYEFAKPHDFRFMGIDITAGHFEIPANCHEAYEGAGGVKGIDVMLDGITPL